MLVDGFGREVTGVRVSLTDRCNFDCVYCHNEGLGDTRGPMEPQDDEMSADDVVRFLEVATEFDIEKVKFTGGEPMLRQDLEEIIERTPGSMEVSMTTNGTFLPGRAPALVEAGLERVNVSQDALDPQAFAEITKSGAYDRVIEGVEAALEAGLDPVKLNMVLFTQTAEYVPKMVDHVAANDGLQLQLIQYMPELTGHADWAVDVDRVHAWLEERADRVETREMHNRRRYWIGGEPSEARRTSEGVRSEPSGSERTTRSRSSADESSTSGGMVEIVDPVENPGFCANCHRVRVTPEGYLKGCLNRNDDLRSMGEMTKDEIRETFRETVENRVPFYGEYMIRDGNGSWEINDAYVDT